MLKKDYDYIYELRLDAYGCSPILMNNEQVMDSFISAAATISNLQLSMDIIDLIDVESGRLSLTIKFTNNFNYYDIVKFVKQYWLSYKVVWCFSIRGHYKIKVIEEGEL